MGTKVWRRAPGVGIFDENMDGLMGRVMKELPGEEREILAAYYGERGPLRDQRRAAYAAGKGMTVEELGKRAFEIRGRLRQLVERLREG